MPRYEPTGELMPRHQRALAQAVRELKARLGGCSDRSCPFQRAEREALEKDIKDANEAMAEVRELVRQGRFGRKYGAGRGREDRYDGKKD